MTSDPPDVAFHTIRVTLKEDQPPLSDSNADTPKPCDWVTAELSLLVRVIGVDRGQATIEKFGKREVVPGIQLSPQPRAEYIFSALETSGYDSVEDVVDEVSDFHD